MAVQTATAGPGVTMPPPVLLEGAIPLIDVADYLAGVPGAAERTAAELRYAFENVGFYYLAGHGVPSSLIDAIYEAAARFHAQPMEAKLAVRVDEHNIGYLTIQDKASRRSAGAGYKPAQNEAYFMRRERTPDDPNVIANRRFHAMNKWPANLPGFRETCLSYMDRLEALCLKLIRVYALALDLPADYFDRAFRPSHNILRLSRYPAIEADDPGANSLPPHTDLGFMTLLPPNKVQGLEILLPNGQWLRAPGVADAFVVNGGDMLHRWSNERFLSTPHRVLNLSGGVRYATPFFFDPNHDTIIECLPSCQSAERPAKYPPVQLGEYAIWFAAQNYQHLAKDQSVTAEQIVPAARALGKW
jgi:isopenicillin N synthase-like dioxygenase